MHYVVQYCNIAILCGSLSMHMYNHGCLRGVLIFTGLVYQHHCKSFLSIVWLLHNMPDPAIM